ncbi:MAG: ABC transporter ATP-binding protein [Propionibacteriaceae bacterium]|jgi:putative ABC transport system ATP-binding protein|nr:ABC transporter ATP-binding protein [Propionibacteriaceae bacterium]
MTEPTVPDQLTRLTEPPAPLGPSDPSEAVDPSGPSAKAAEPATVAADDPAAPLIATTKLSKTFSHQGVQQHVLRNVDLEIQAGRLTVIMGSSGAGKSTLLYALSGMDSPTLGDIRFQGRSLVGLSQSQLARFRRRACGFVFQQINLIDTLSLMDNVMAAGLLVDKDRTAVAAKANQLFDLVGLDAAVRRKFPAQTSGGEAQRAAIVRALINSPQALFADEPTGALDQASGTAVLDLLSRLRDDGQSVVMVTHDLKSARRGDRVVYLRDGQIAGDLDLTEAPAAERSERLLDFLAELGW